jgi:hypothetical protein
MMMMMMRISKLLKFYVNVIMHLKLSVRMICYFKNGKTLCSVKLACCCENKNESFVRIFWL